MPEQERDCVFSCPSCGSPSARTVEPDLDIHAGAIYRCDQCLDPVIFEAFTPKRYVETANLSARVAELEAGLEEALREWQRWSARLFSLVNLDPAGFDALKEARLRIGKLASLLPDEQREEDDDA